MDFVLPALTAFVLTVVLCILALKIFPRMGLLDKPHRYGLKRKPIPYPGGLCIIAAFFITVGLFFEMNRELFSVLLGVFILGLTCFLDDRYRLSPFLRLGVQFLVGFIVVAGGIGVHSITNPLGGSVPLDRWEFSVVLGTTAYTFHLLNVLFTVFWIVAMINTMNWIDGLNGLPSGISTIGFFVLFLLSIRPNFHAVDQSAVAHLSLVLAVIALAFWFFDFAPAKMLMGDTGSMFFGFMLAVLAIFSGGKIATAFLVMGFPILDAVWVIARRIWRRQSPFKGDLKHLHHRLLEAGFSERQALILIYMLCAGFGSVALFLGSIQKLVAIFFMIAVMVVLGVVVVLRAGKRTA